MSPAPDPLEDLLAEALAVFDQHGEPGLAAFLAEHQSDRPALERGLHRCRQMGLLGDQPAAAREFPDRLGEFRLLRRLGSGGMGVVYEAEQLSLQRRVALKVVRPELLYFEGARERFVREIEAVARLSHPAIVPVLASGEQDGLPWYAMELLDGKSVHDVCAALADRDPAELTASDLRRVLGSTPQTGTDLFAGAWWQLATRIVHAIALGVRHAHLRGIVHRDIKPSNVMLTTDGRAVLLDFGIARIQGGAEFTRTGNTPGSPGFMSPEQLRGDAVDERTDVYSLAATLWQLLTLAPPFAGVDDLPRIQLGELPDLRSKNDQVPRELALVVMTAMDRDRERRYADVGAFADDLQAVLQRRPIRARRLGAALRGLRWCQRHRVVATTLGVLLAVVLVLPFLFAWRERGINQELQEAVATAERSLATTLDAIDGILVTLANDRLRFVPEAEPVTLAALQQAATMYRTLLREHPEHDRLCADACKALGRLAAHLLRTGDREGAIATYEEAIRTASTDRVLLDAELLTWRASARLNLAGLYLEHGTGGRRADLLTAAEQDYRRLRDYPRRASSSDYGLSQVAAQRADLPAIARDAAASRRQLELCVEFVRAALTTLPDSPEYLLALARGLDNLATFLLQGQRDDPAADALLDEALLVARRIPVDAPVWPPQPVLESDVLETLGNLQLTRKDPRARSTLSRCIELRQHVVAGHPEDIDLATRLGGALHNLARTYCNDDEPDGYQTALALLERAIPLQRAVLARAPDYTRARLFLTFHLRLSGNCLSHLGRPAALEAIAAELATDTGNAEHQRATARFWLRALAMRGDDVPQGGPDHREQALAALLQAERCGWRSTSRLTEAIYAPLHDLPAFQELRTRLAALPAQAVPK